MPRRSSKHATLDRRMVVPISGVDLSMPANAIADNMLSRAYNWWYEPERGLCVRQGLVREDVETLASPIVAMHPYVDATGTLRLLAASGDKLYERNAAVWDEVVAVDTDAHVSMTTFNGSALIADGAGTGILKYDGSTVGVISGSPAKPMCITSIANRVVCASADVPDYVYFSGANDLTDWSTTAPGTAVTIAAGFGDGYTITGFATIYDLLIVSKVKRDTTGAIVGRKMYAISTAGTTDQWFVKLVSSENAAMLPGAIVGVGEVAFILDTNGAKVISPTPNGQFGDVAVDAMVGVRVNKKLGEYAKLAQTSSVVYIPSLSQVWFVAGLSLNSRIFCWHPMQSAWTQIDFGRFIPRAIASLGETIYIGGDDGALYVLSNVGTDELEDDVLTPIYASVRSRVFEGLGGDLILKKIKTVLEPLLASSVLIEAYISETNERIPFGSVSISDGAAGFPVYDANGALSNATYLLSSNERMVHPMFYGGPRAAGIAMQVRVLGGRVTLNSITGEFAVVGR